MSLPSTAMQAEASSRHVWPPALGLDLVIGVSLAFVGGFVDSAGFVSLAGLFTSHVTGNFVLISEEIVSGSGGAVAKLAALPVFIAAVAATRLIALAFERRHMAPLRPLLVVEALVLLAFLASGESLPSLRLPASTVALLVGMFGVAAMGVQNAIGRLMVAHLPATTVMTVNVSQMTIDALDTWRRTASPDPTAAKIRLRRVASAVMAFASGTLAGALGTIAWSFAAISVPIVVLLGLAGLLTKSQDANS